MMKTYLNYVFIFRRCQMMKLEADAKIESAGLAQAKQASLVDRLQVRNHTCEI